MSIEKIVEQALQDGYLTPVMETEVGRICDTASELSIEEYMALDRLMGALLTGEVVAVPRKQFINVMEELVLTEAIAQVAEIEATSDQVLAGTPGQIQPAALFCCGCAVCANRGSNPVTVR